MAKQTQKASPSPKKTVAPKKNVVSAKKPASVPLKKAAKPGAKGVAKKVAVKKAAPKAIPSAKKQITNKTSKPVAKSAPAKKTTKPDVKKASSTKIPAKSATASKPKDMAKKPVDKTIKEAPAKVSSKKQKPEEDTNDHKKQLKTAMAKSTKSKEESKKPQKPFVMPKTSTDKSRKYEPQFVKSVLDQAPEENNGPSMRYSDSELVEFRELITKKLETAKKELGYLQGLITRKDEMGGDDTDNRYMTMEDGSLSMEREQLSQMASRQITFIDHLEKAMMRIENKTYGICRVTGKLIDKARLRAVPHATLSIEAKMGISR
ncbi:MAG: TraR/DksA C4-type zinc finger protein [Ginsengibacter sp.]